jgi:AcrR family transcriptional regulator
MNSLDPQAVARRPTQERARARFDRVLEEAEAVLADVGLGGFSIPVVAERTGFTRGSVYSYFPTPHALLNELAKRYLSELEASLVGGAAEVAGLPWRRAIEYVIDRTVEYHKDRPVARLLLLGGAVTDDSFRAQELTVKRLGKLGRQMLKAHGISLPVRSPDVATLAIDIGVACLRRSVFEHGAIVPSYRNAAVGAMVGFLQPYVTGANNKRRA